MSRYRGDPNVTTSYLGVRSRLHCVRSQMIEFGNRCLGPQSHWGSEGGVRGHEVQESVGEDVDH